MLTALLRYSLFGGPEPTIDAAVDWQSLMETSRHEGVSALVYDAVVSLPPELRPPRNILFRWASLVNTIETANRQRSTALLHFAQWSATYCHTDAVVVKGLSLARHYPNPLYRESSDVDVYFGAQSDNINAQLEQSLITVDRTDPRHATFLFDNVPFEGHAFLLYRPVGDNHSSVDPMWHPVASPYPHLRWLPDSESALFVAAHADHHAVFHNEPLRLHELVDWALLISNKDFDYTVFQQLKRHTEVDHFADLLTHYCHQLFGITIPPACAPVSANALRCFPAIYRSAVPRRRHAVLRVVRRSGKYLHYHKVYREIYGRSMFSRFYRHNVCHALKQLLQGAPRHDGRQ